MAVKRDRSGSGDSANERAGAVGPSNDTARKPGESPGPGPHEPPVPADPHRQRFPVVGIGASAGGIGALREFFQAMSADSGMAFVVILHLAPLHDSQMAEILAKSTAMKVVEAADGMPAQPDTVFTNPPGRALSIRDGRLVLAMPPERQRVEAAIDRFLISLAADQGEWAVGIILSGSTAVDGPRGVRAVRAAGGMCMAQDPQTAAFPAMPQGAIDTGLVDHVLPVSQMPAVLLAYAQHRQIGP